MKPARELGKEEKSHPSKGTAHVKCSRNNIMVLQPEGAGSGSSVKCEVGIAARGEALYRGSASEILLGLDAPPRLYIFSYRQRETSKGL